MKEIGRKTRKQEKVKHEEKNNFHLIYFFKGKLTFANGDSYEGDFMNNKRNGKGTIEPTIIY